MPYTLTARMGNLVMEPKATFIVNASNTQMLLGSGVSMAFKRRCGSGLEAVMRRKLEAIEGGIHPGDVVATSSGEAGNFRYALHAAVMNYDPGVRQRDKFPTLETIRMILESIEAYLSWYAAHHSPQMKLVLPLLGCGIGGLDKWEVLEQYREFFLRDVAYACEVVVYGYSAEDYGLIRDVMTGTNI